MLLFQLLYVSYYNSAGKLQELFKKKMLRKIIPDYISDQEIQDIKNSISLDKQIKDAETIE